MLSHDCLPFKKILLSFVLPQVSLLLKLIGTRVVALCVVEAACIVQVVLIEMESVRVVEAASFKDVERVLVIVAWFPLEHFSSFRQQKRAILLVA